MLRLPLPRILCVASLLSSPPAGAQEFAAGHLFVVARPNANVEIVELDETGALVRAFGGNAGMDIGGGLAFGHDGKLYVADVGDTGFYVFEASGAGNVVGNLTLGSSASHLSVGPRGNLLVLADNTDALIESTVAGVPLRSFDLQLNARSANQLLLLADGHLLLSSLASGIAEFDPAGKFVRTIGAAAGHFGGIAFNAEGHPLVLNATGEVSELDAAGNVVVSFGRAAGLVSPRALAHGSDGLVYVADVSASTNAIFRLDESGSGGRFSAPPVALNQARGVAFAPFRFDAKIVGKLTPNGGAPRSVSETAILTWYPGFPSAFVSLADGPSSEDLASTFGASTWVFSGFLVSDDKALVRRRFVGSEIAESSLAGGTATIDLTAKGKLSSAGFFAPTGASAQITRIAPDAVFTGKLVTKTLRR